MTETTPDFVRPAQVGDAARFAAIQVPNMRACLQQGTDGPLSQQVVNSLDREVVQAQWEKTVAAPPQVGQHVLTAVSEGQVVGFAASYLTSESGKPVCEIIALEVDGEHTGKGNGSRLLAAVSDLAKEDGAATIQVWLVAGDSERIRFYQGAGLGPAGPRRTLALSASEQVVEHLWWASLE